MYNVLIVPIAYLINQCRIIIWLVGDYYKAQLVYLQSTDGNIGELRERLMFQLHDTSFGNYHTNLFDISSNCLVCGNSDKNYGDKDGYEVTLV